MSSRSCLSDLLIIVILGISLAGCQHSSSFDHERSRDAWRVMERVGDIRMVSDDGFGSRSLRPGEQVVDDRRVTTSTSSLVILSRDGFQLTAGENTSFRLPTAQPASDLFLERGWLRIRLVRSVDQQVRIKTAEFDINASKATLILHADPAGTTLTVEAGSAALATTDGRHRATLVAGAAAKMDPTSSRELLLQPAAGRGFTKVSPLSTSTRPSHGDQNPAPPEKTTPRSAAPSSPGSDFVILPASRRKGTSDNPAKSKDVIANAAPAPELTDPEPRWQNLQRADIPALRQEHIIPSSMPEDEPPFAGNDQRTGEPSYDPLQLKFDQLTKGLVDGL